MLNDYSESYIGENVAKYTVEITDAEEKALLGSVASIQDWISNAIHNMARKCIDAIILEQSDKQPSKVSEPERSDIVINAVVEPVSELEEVAKEA